MIILRLPPNTKGRDFVCGDIHGSYSCIEKFLKKIKFRRTKDRLICAGDLIDRGPENEKCLDLINKKWFFCTIGNHEELMHAYFTGGPYGQWWHQNGGYWGTKYSDLSGQAADPDMKAFIQSCIPKIANLPYLITVEKKSGGVFHVLHAELPTYNALVDKQGQITDATLADPDKFTELATVKDHNGNTIVWGRYIFRSLSREVIDDRRLRKFKRIVEIEKLGHIFNPELSHIYSGHTIMRRPVTFLGQTNLDTCAYGSYPSRYDPQPEEWCGLTVTEPETGKFWLVNDREFKEVEPIVIEI